VVALVGEDRLDVAPEVDRGGRRPRRGEQAGEDRETAYYTTYRGVAKVVLASGLTIAGAVFCMKFTRLPYFHALAVPCAVGIVVAVVVALTLVPAVLTVGSRFGLFEPKRKITVRRWRRIGTAVVRWPGPILIATVAVTLVGLLALPGYRPSYNEAAAKDGWAKALAHFKKYV
jgi:RND superfamily putative drug exporter